ncbi:putative integral membrane transport protein [Pseudonocardia sp. Ae168_Ps1]|uniref:MSCRAMM family protein n=1 Tax=unclassified Pseudonocardia TaxID=2619320 RepID=UPI00094B5258|nr:MULTISPECIES: carboxypeptidase-like regulatory domain-containing protein [unclassified Pseudonocardia]OLL76344.1 putative integral membrane transport protein [Pseudonocardia sp. Ae150A_Ps1]OLL82343.1 putative integral membrane transport protein [Pseudonocardia sp. Ae168_Ps1]OLL83541.1 putative integral membrane transport protein [Pseudonocardia sp. Ae263_Ps1]OLL90420.1 putative integral membrane transport protein [Pseudonocardia sp. Ae356_Ps1]
MTTGPSITGTVRRRGGNPVPAATVTVTDLDGRQHGRATTGEDGSWSVPLGTGGTYLVVVRAEGSGPDAGLVAVRDSPARHDVVTTGGGTVHGVLTDGAGVPVPAAAVTLIDQSGEVVGHGPTGPDGRFRLETPGTGPHTLTVTAPGHQPVARTVTAGPPGPPVEIRLPARAGLAGTARTSDGRPVAGARMALTDLDGRTVATTTTGPDGRYELRDLPPGRHSLTASGHPPVVAAVQIDRGATTPVQVHFPDPRGAAAGTRTENADE